MMMMMMLGMTFETEVIDTREGHTCIRPRREKGVGIHVQTLGKYRILTARELGLKGSS